MSLVREYRPQDYRQVEECFIELQDFERQSKLYAPRAARVDSSVRHFQSHLNRGPKMKMI